MMITGKQKKRWEDIEEWTGLELAASLRAVENKRKMEGPGCEVIFGDPHS